MENTEKISIKKLLLCIICGVILTTAIGMTMLFIENAPVYMEALVIDEVDRDTAEFKEYILHLEKHGHVTQFYNDIEENYEEDYPANGLFQYEITNSMRILMSQGIVETYTLTFVIGVFLGAMVYIIFIQKARGMRLISEILIVIASVYLIMIIVNLGFDCILRNWIKDSTYQMNTGFDYSSYIYDYLDNRLLISFAVILVLMFVIRLIKQKKQK